MTIDLKRMPVVDDSLCLVRIKSKDRRAFESLYLSYRGRLGRFLRRFTDSSEVIEEIINDSFMIIWLGADKFRGESLVSTWIFGIAYRTAMKALRRNPKLCYLSELTDVHELTFDPSDELESRDWLDSAMRNLTTDQHTTMRLAYEFGYSVAEIAAITASPQSTVKTRMFLGRNNLRGQAIVQELERAK